MAKSKKKVIKKVTKKVVKKKVTKAAVSQVVVLEKQLQQIQKSLPIAYKNEIAGLEKQANKWQLAIKNNKDKITRAQQNVFNMSAKDKTKLTATTKKQIRTAEVTLQAASKLEKQLVQQLNTISLKLTSLKTAQNKYAEQVKAIKSAPVTKVAVPKTTVTRQPATSEVVPVKEIKTIDMVHRAMHNLNVDKQEVKVKTPSIESFD